MAWPNLYLGYTDQSLGWPILHPLGHFTPPWFTVWYPHQVSNDTLYIQRNASLLTQVLKMVTNTFIYDRCYNYCIVG